MTSREVIRKLEDAGFELVRVSGSHHVLKGLSGSIVVVPHPRKDIPRGTLKSIERQSGVKLGGK